MYGDILTISVTTAYVPALHRAAPLHDLSYMFTKSFVRVTCLGLGELGERA